MRRAEPHETFAGYLRGSGLTADDSVAGHEEWDRQIKDEYRVAVEALKDLDLLK